MENFENLLYYIRENDVEEFNSLVDKLHLDSGDASDAIVQAVQNIVI